MNLKNHCSGDLKYLKNACLFILIAIEALDLSFISWFLDYKSLFCYLIVIFAGGRVCQCLFYQ